MTTITQARALEIQVTQRVAARYNGVLPVKLRFEEHVLFQGWYNITAEVPGQTRTVAVTAKQLKASTTPEGLDEIIDEVLFAIFLLLDEGEDE